jgi:hypothetical protein
MEIGNDYGLLYVKKEIKHGPSIDFMQPYNFNCKSWNESMLTYPKYNPKWQFSICLCQSFQSQDDMKIYRILNNKITIYMEKPNTKRVLDLDIIILYFHCIFSITTNVPTNNLTQHTTLVKSNSNVLHK